VAEPQASPRARGSRLAFADGIRGLAALWVVLFHTSKGRHVDHLMAVLPTWFNSLVFDWGHLGVALFFVLSGFVMMHSLRGLAALRMAASKTTASAVAWAALCSCGQPLRMTGVC